jgi:NAD(P)-dependent dehydrogenase (short-subunit alcohol dehydrogenase family)
VSAGSRPVAIITGGSQGIGAGLVDGYRQLGWAVVANSLTIKPAEDPNVLAVRDKLEELAAAIRADSGQALVLHTAHRLQRHDPPAWKAGLILYFP